LESQQIIAFRIESLPEANDIGKLVDQLTQQSEADAI